MINISNKSRKGNKGGRSLAEQMSAINVTDVTSRSLVMESTEDKPVDLPVDRPAPLVVEPVVTAHAHVEETAEPVTETPKAVDVEETTVIAEEAIVVVEEAAVVPVEERVLSVTKVVVPPVNTEPTGIFSAFAKARQIVAEARQATIDAEKAEKAARDAAFEISMQAVRSKTLAERRDVKNGPAEGFQRMVAEKSFAERANDAIERARAAKKPGFFATLFA